MLGLIVPTVTPFRNGNVDPDGVKRLCAYYRRVGVRTLFPIGTTGEFPLLTLDERLQLLRLFKEACGDDIELIPHVGAAGLVEAKALCAEASRLGIRRVAAVTPYFFAHDQEALIAYYQALCAAHPELSFFLYTIPQRAGNTLTLESVERLAALSNVEGIKDSTGDLERLRALVALGKLAVVAGADDHALPFLQAGGHGFVSGPGAVIPELFQALMQAHAAGDQAAAGRAFELIRAFGPLIGNGGRIDLIREGLRWRGVDTGESRQPLPRLQNQEREDFQRKMDSFAQQVISAGITYPAPLARA